MYMVRILHLLHFVCYLNLIFYLDKMFIGPKRKLQSLSERPADFIHREEIISVQSLKQDLHKNNKK